jgi:hypothetical protein
MLKPIKTKPARASDGKLQFVAPPTEYALQEYGLTSAETTKAEKRIATDLKAARKRGEVTPFNHVITL